MPCLLRGSSPGERELFSFDHFADLIAKFRAVGMAVNGYGMLDRGINQLLR
jgi:hypothetical protein